MLMNMKSNSKVGKAITETASIAYDGTLLPAGTAKYGSELVTDVEITNPSYWTVVGAGTISNGKFIANGTGFTTINGLNNGILTIGKTYIIEVVVSSVTAGSFSMANAGNAIGNSIYTVGTHVLVYTSTTTGTVGVKRNTEPFNFEIDSISVKEVLINPNTRYLKDLGKDKNHVLVESGQGKFFNGSNQYINTGIIPNQAQGTLVTRFTYASSGIRCIFGAVNSDATARLALQTDPSGKLAFPYMDIQSTNGITQTPFTLTAGRSYHVAVKYTGNNIKCYIDGVKVVEYNSTANQTFNAPLFIGALNYGNAVNFFNSVIDETYYYDVALTDAQIMSLYQYPEKIKVIYNVDDPTRYKIVPDIGNEDNCKLLLPMSESNSQSASNLVANLAVPLVNEGYFNNTFSMASSIFLFLSSTSFVILGFFNHFMK